MDITFRDHRVAYSQFLWFALIETPDVYIFCLIELGIILWEEAYSKHMDHSLMQEL